MVVHVYHQVNTINNPWHKDLYGNSRNANGTATINSPAIHSHAPDYRHVLLGTLRESISEMGEVA